MMRYKLSEQNEDANGDCTLIKKSKQYKLRVPLNLI